MTFFIWVKGPLALTRTGYTRDRPLRLSLSSSSLEPLFKNMHCQTEVVALIYGLQGECRELRSAWTMETVEKGKTGGESRSSCSQSAHVWGEAGVIAEAAGQARR